MINEIPTRLANMTREQVGDSWFVESSFTPVKIPKSVKWVYDILVGDEPLKTVPQLMCVLRCVDIQEYKSAFDSRELFDYPDGSSIYSLLTNVDGQNTLNAFLANRESLIEVFSGDEYLKSLFDLYTGTNEGTIKLCAVILAVTYRLKLAS